MGRFGRLLGYLRPYRWALVASATTGVVASLFDGFTFTLLIPFLRLLFGGGDALPATPSVVERVVRWVTGPFVESASPATALTAVLLLIVVAVAIKSAASYASSYLAIATQERVVRDLRVRLFDHMLTLGFPYFQGVRGGQFLARILSDADQTRQTAGAALVAVLKSGTAAVVYAALLFALSWRLAVIVLVLAPALALVLRPVLRSVRRRVGRAVAWRGELAAVVGETIAGVRLVKAHGAEPEERRRFRDTADRHLGGALAAQRVALLSAPLGDLLGATVIVLLLMAGTQAAGLGGLRPEVFVTFVALALRLLSPVKALSQFPALAAEALAGADRIFEVLDRPSDDVDESGALAFPGVERDLVWRDVWFAYEPQRWVLRGVDLTVRRGQVVAVVGPSGAGKSTLVDLLPRFIEPQRGDVLVDGVPVRCYARRSIRRALGIVSQETVVFHDTVRANIAYGDPEPVDPLAVEAAARAANAHPFIARLPQGYDTVLGERGMRLSGGERQRIAIARALYRDPPILILDEATSALDPETERLVQEAIERLLANRTVFIVAHRYSTIARADRILLLEHGTLSDFAPPGAAAGDAAARAWWERATDVNVSS